MLIFRHLPSKSRLRRLFGGMVFSPLLKRLSATSEHLRNLNPVIYRTPLKAFGIRSVHSNQEVVLLAALHEQIFSIQKVFGSDFAIKRRQFLFV